MVKDEELVQRMKNLGYSDSKIKAVCESKAYPELKKQIFNLDEVEYIGFGSMAWGEHALVGATSSDLLLMTKSVMTIARKALFASYSENYPYKRMDSVHSSTSGVIYIKMAGDDKKQHRLSFPPSERDIIMKLINDGM